MSASNPIEPLPSEERNDPRPLLVLLIVLCSILVVTYALRLDERDRVEEAIAAQTAANEDARARSAELRDTLEKVNRPAHLELIIRGFLGLGKEGDIRLVPVDAPDLPMLGAPAPDVAAAPSGESAPVWRQWLTLFLPRQQRQASSTQPAP